MKVLSSQILYFRYNEEICNDSTMVMTQSVLLEKILPSRILFIFFLLSLPYSLRKVMAVYSENGIFNEYMDVSLYLSDILLLIVLCVYIIEHKNNILSIDYWRQMFHVEHLLLPIILPLYLIFWSGASIFWSESVAIAVASFLRLIEGYFLYLFILLNVPRGTLSNCIQKCSTWNKVDQPSLAGMFHVEHSSNSINRNVPRGTWYTLLSFIHKCSTWNIVHIALVSIIFSGFSQSIIAILQFIKQKSLGITLLGESIFSPADVGVAKVVIGDEILVRSYAFFPHPNILGGFLAVSVLISMFYPLIYSDFFSRISAQCSTWNISRSWFSQMFHVEHFKWIWLYKIIIFTQITALFFTFSKSAMGGLFLGLVTAFFMFKKMFHVEHSSVLPSNVPRGTLADNRNNQISECSTWNIFAIYTKIHKMFHVEHLFIFTGIVFLIAVITTIDQKLLIFQPISERLFHIQLFQGLSKALYFHGLGMGQYVYSMPHFFNEKLLDWQLQPVHNVFLLVLSELGIIGLLFFLSLFIVSFVRLIHFVPRGTFLYDGQKLTSKCSTWNIFAIHTKIHKMFHVEQRKPLQNLGIWRVNTIFGIFGLSLLITVWFIIMFDHYLWDIQQGQLLFWLLLAITVSKRY